jgi:hypothetical protein
MQDDRGNHSCAGVFGGHDAGEALSTEMPVNCGVNLEYDNPECSSNNIRVERGCTQSTSFPFWASGKGRASDISYVVTPIPSLLLQSVSKSLESDSVYSQEDKRADGKALTDVGTEEREGTFG